MSLTVIHTGKTVLANNWYLTVIIRQYWTKTICETKEKIMKIDTHLRMLNVLAIHSKQTLITF